MNIRILAFALIITTVLVAFSYSGSISAYDYTTVTWSNIGAEGTLPELYLDDWSTVLMNNGVPMINITTLANYMGATVSYGTNWYLDKNGQTTMFIPGSTEMWTTNTYQYYDPVTHSNDTYTQTWVADMPVAPMNWNGFKYVPLIIAAKQMGALLAESYNSTYRVYDFRINESTPFSDSNEYIVGGKWLHKHDASGNQITWLSTTNGNTNLSDHFDTDEIWSSVSSSYGDYSGQLKISVSSLETAERVRHYFLNDTSLYLSCAFRGWAYNNSLLGHSPVSHHMRGRAWDAALDSLYYTAYNEFKSSNLKPDDFNGYWRSWVYATSNSRGYEIEKIPIPNGNVWLHMQREPDSSSQTAP